MSVKFYSEVNPGDFIFHAGYVYRVEDIYTIGGDVTMVFRNVENSDEVYQVTMSANRTATIVDYASGVRGGETNGALD